MRESGGAWFSEQGFRCHLQGGVAVCNENDALAVFFGGSLEDNLRRSTLASAAKELRDALTATRAWCVQYASLPEYCAASEAIVSKMEDEFFDGCWRVEYGYTFRKGPACGLLDEDGLIGITTAMGIETDLANAFVMASARGNLKALVVARAWCTQFEHRKGHEAATSCILNVIDRALNKSAILNPSLINA